MRKGACCAMTSKAPLVRRLGASSDKQFRWGNARNQEGVFEVKLFPVTSNDSVYYDCGGYREFAEIVPLPVYGLDAGVYTYRVFSLPIPPIYPPITPRSIGGSFQIPRKNSFSSVSKPNKP